MADDERGNSITECVCCTVGFCDYCLCLIIIIMGSLLGG